MESSELTGIERELVLQYLIDGNVPVTITLLDDKKSDGDNSGRDSIKPANSAVFPVAIKAEKVKVMEQGIILLYNPPQNIKEWLSSKVKVEFYFNRLGLFFISELKEVSAGLALVIPSSISRISEIPVARPLDFSAVLYFSMNDKAGIHFDCYPCKGYKLFSKPVWSDIDENVSRLAKSYLEEFIVHARSQGTAGNGIQLIPVCRYISEKRTEMHPIQGRSDPFDIIYVDHERIVFASTYANLKLASGTEYALEMGFPLPKPLTMKRRLFVTLCVEGIYSDKENEFACAVCRYTSIKEEDVRYLYEKCTNTLFV